MTGKVCITSEKDGECKQFSGGKNVRRVVIDIPESVPQASPSTLLAPSTDEKDVKKRKDAAEIIDMEVANAMFDCWAMTGEGKLNVFKGADQGDVGESFSEFVGLEGVAGIVGNVKQPKCVVCSRVAIADDILKTEEGNAVLGEGDVNGYLARKNVPGTAVTYFEKFTSGKDSRSFAGIDNLDESKNPYAKASKVVDQIGIIFVQINTELDPGEAGLQGALAGGTLIGGATAVTTKNIPLALIAGLGGAVGGLFFAEDTASNSQAISAAACGAYIQEGKNKAKLGCSLVKPIDWRIENINALCPGGIEGRL